MRAVAELLLNWYALNSRKLPWRDNPDPYSVWVSEIMLQQTRVETVVNYYIKWMKKFPTLADLADATEDEVLSTWEGLGYYSRVRNFHKAARIVMDTFNGNIPGEIQELVKLPGIGRYTAGAIASIAFHADEPTLDANIRRVFSRLFNIEENVDYSGGKKKLWTLLRQELPPGKAGDFNQALMDLGATICVTKNPLCEVCPFCVACRAYLLGVQEQRPILKAKKNRPYFTYVAAILKDKEKILLLKRPSKGLLGGLWEFPNARVIDGTNDLEIEVVKLMIENFDMTVKVKSKHGIFNHAYTHFHQTMIAFNCGFEKNSVNSNNNKWVPVFELQNYPMGKIARLISKSLLIDEAQ